MHELWKVSINPGRYTSTREGIHQPERECADLVHDVFEFVDEAEEFAAASFVFVEAGFALEYHLALVVGHRLDEFFDHVVVLARHVIVEYDAGSGLGE